MEPAKEFLKKGYNLDVATVAQLDAAKRVHVISYSSIISVSLMAFSELSFAQRRHLIEQYGARLKRKRRVTATRPRRSSTATDGSLPKGG